jgi:hypothetical protein
MNETFVVRGNYAGLSMIYCLGNEELQKGNKFNSEKIHSI